MRVYECVYDGVDVDGTSVRVINRLGDEQCCVCVSYGAEADNFFLLLMPRRSTNWHTISASHDLANGEFCLQTSVCVRDGVDANVLDFVLVNLFCRLQSAGNY